MIAEVMRPEVSLSDMMHGTRVMQRQYVLPSNAYTDDGSDAVGSCPGCPDEGSIRDAAELSNSVVLGSKFLSKGSSSNVRDSSPSGGPNDSGTGVDALRVSSSSRISGRAKSVWHAAGRG